MAAPKLYITAADLKAAAQESESSGNDFWETLAKGVSRLFDRECEVADEFFAPADQNPSVKTFRGAGHEYLKILPYIADSIAAITVDGSIITVPTITREYTESDDFLVFAYAIAKNAPVSVSARWGFVETPADIKLACIEQALFQWRRKDLAFADLSGVPTAAVTAQFSPSFQAAVNRFRGLYSANLYFS